MARYEHQLLPAPSGMATAIEPASLPLNKAQFVQGFTPGRFSVLQQSVSVQAITGFGTNPYFGGQTQVSTMIFYRGTRRDYDRILIFDTGGGIYAATFHYVTNTSPSNHLTYNIVLDTVDYMGQFPNHLWPPPDDVYCPYSSVRSAQYRDEMYLVRETRGAPSALTNYPLRFYVAGGDFGPGQNKLYLLGTATPGAPVPTADAVNATNLLATTKYTYQVVYLDERGRASSPSGQASITTAGTPKKTDLTVTWPTGVSDDPQLTTAVFFRVAQGTANAYQIASVARDFTQPTTVYVDDTLEATLVSGPLLVITPGENDRPNAAGKIAVWQNRLVLDDATDRTGRTIQISNADSPTQFSSLALPGNTTDGIRTPVGSDPGDPVMGFAVFGSFLAIFKLRTVFMLAGQDMTNFRISEAAVKGCVATDSIVRCDNVVVFLADDGFYYMSAADGLMVHPLSNDIWDQFFGFRLTQQVFGPPIPLSGITDDGGTLQSFQVNP